jgi:DNA polymerase-3 subunit gamma/tau
MSYLALARKWRPRSFQELVGQEHVVRALTNALDSGRVHHAFLFTGTRGVGKTTIARILAKSLNCETGVSARPCGVCSACREIDEGRFVDLIEVDAASRTKVEDTRELLENVPYAPARGRYKVYLIDEVHMLSTHSFNALLKTLEEPPPHMKFLLATTDPQKLPITVLSRCLQFHLKRLPVGLIGERMTSILGAESIPFEPPALPLIARAADGSMRDALSLLDQALVFGAGKIETADVRSMLGTIDRGHVVHLLERLADGDARGLVEVLKALDEQAPDYDQLLVEVATLLERLTLVQLVPDSGADGGFDPEMLARLAPRFAAEDLQLYYQIALIGRRDLELAPEPRVGFEMTALRMLAFRPAAAGAPDPGASRPGTAAPPAAPRAPTVGARAPVAAPVTASATPDWQELLGQLDITGAARQLAANCLWVGRDGDSVRLRLDRRSEGLRTAATEERLAQALSRHFGVQVRLVFERDSTPEAPEAADTPARREARAQEAEVSQARASLEADPTVRALREKFGATVQPETVKPVR